MVRLTDVFRRLRASGAMAFIPYLTAGYPSLSVSMEMYRKFAEWGADIIEIGVPFSDPIADGPVIQRATHTALQQGVTLRDILAALRDTSIPAAKVLMSYLNPLLAYGRERLLADLRAVDVVGLIIPDLPVEEADVWWRSAREHDIDLVFLVAPTSTETRIRKIAARATGFLYCVSVTGTTGERDRLPAGLVRFLDRVRGFTDCPLAVGFGIRDPEQVKHLRGHADGVVVGSRIIRAIHEGEDVASLIRAFHWACRGE